MTYAQAQSHNHKVFNNILGNMREAKPAALTAAAIAMKQYFLSMFDAEKWEDGAWPELSETTTRKKGDGLKKLVESGDLREALSKIDESAILMGSSIKLWLDVPYAAVHNEGLQSTAWGKTTFDMPKRQFWGETYELNKKVTQAVKTSLLMSRLFRR